MTNHRAIAPKEQNTQVAANRLERFAALIGINQCEITWLTESGLYRIIANHSTDFEPTEDAVIRHLIQVARVWRKT